jgi:hypothetical protein
MTSTELRTFYLSGKGLEEFRPTRPLRPKVLDEIELPLFHRNYPLCLAGSEPLQPLYRLLEKTGEPSDSLDAAASAAADRAGSLSCGPLSTVTGSRLPKEGWLIGFGKWTAPLVSCVALERARREARESFLAELRDCGQRLEEMLAADHRNSAGDLPPNAVTESLGERAPSLFDSRAWAEALSRRKNPAHAMEPERRARCEAALAAIEDGVCAMNLAPAVTLIHAGEAPIGEAPETPPALRIEHDAVAAGESVCERALAVFERQLRCFVPVWKALRVARLELESAFDPARHSTALEEFDWTMAHANELQAIPVVVAVENAPGIERSLGAFARVVKSGYPVQILIDCPNGLDNDLGCLPLAYQDAFVLSSSLGAPEHMVRGLLEMARTLRPAIAVVATAESWMEAALLEWTRVWPLFRYDPGLGASWRERFALQASGSRDDLTFAHAATLMPGFRGDFRVLPAGSGLDDDLPALPVCGQNGVPDTAVFTRTLAGVCKKVESRRRLVTELAGGCGSADSNADAENRCRMEGATQAIQQAIALLSGASENA